MKNMPWKKIALVCGILVALVVGRAAVTIGRANYWNTDWLGPIQQDPWIYVGFLAAALGIIAWTKLPGPEAEETAEAAEAEIEAEIEEENAPE